MLAKSAFNCEVNSLSAFEVVILLREDHVDLKLVTVKGVVVRYSLLVVLVCDVGIFDVMVMVLLVAGVEVVKSKVDFVFSAIKSVFIASVVVIWEVVSICLELSELLSVLTDDMGETGFLVISIDDEVVLIGVKLTVFKA